VDADEFQVREFGVGREAETFEVLRQLQDRRAGRVADVDGSATDYRR